MEGFRIHGQGLKQRIQTFTMLPVAVQLVKHLKLSSYRFGVGSRGRQEGAPGMGRITTHG